MASNSITSLSNVSVGQRVWISMLCSTPETCSRLREMGFCENAVVRCVMKGEETIICEVCNTRIGLNSTIANSIDVAPFE